MVSQEEEHKTLSTWENCTLKKDNGQCYNRNSGLKCSSGQTSMLCHQKSLYQMIAVQVDSGPSPNKLSSQL